MGILNSIMSQSRRNWTWSFFSRFLIPTFLACSNSLKNTQHPKVHVETNRMTLHGIREVDPCKDIAISSLPLLSLLDAYFSALLGTFAPRYSKNKIIDPQTLCEIITWPGLLYRCQLENKKLHHRSNGYFKLDYVTKQKELNLEFLFAILNSYISSLLK